MNQNVKVHSTKLKTTSKYQIKYRDHFFLFFAFLKVLAGESTCCRLLGDAAEKELINLNKFNPSNISTSTGKGKKNRSGTVPSVHNLKERSSERTKKTFTIKGSLFETSEEAPLEIDL